MTLITGGELLARALANEGARFVFGLPCLEIDPLLVALASHGIRFVPVRHEAAAVHMAEGLYKTTGQVAVVLGNPGPGTANLFPGLVTARHEGVPVLAISSQHRGGIVYPATPATFQGQSSTPRPTLPWRRSSRTRLAVPVRRRRRKRSSRPRRGCSRTRRHR